MRRKSEVCLDIHIFRVCSFADRTPLWTLTRVLSPYSTAKQLGQTLQSLMSTTCLAKDCSVFYVCPDCSDFAVSQRTRALSMAASLLRYQSLPMIKSLCISTDGGATFSTSVCQGHDLFSNLPIKEHDRRLPCLSSFPRHQLDQEPANSVHHHQDRRLHLQPAGTTRLQGSQGPALGSRPRNPLLLASLARRPRPKPRRRPKTPRRRRAKRKRLVAGGEARARVVADDE
jgi:hypothetical protein